MLEVIFFMQFGDELMAEKRNEPSPSMMASLSAAIEKSPRTFTAVTLGHWGTAKCLPGGNA